MKKIRIIYWTTTVIFAVFMGFTAIGDVVLEPEAVKFMTQLGYPNYFTVFIGVAKLLGATALLIPGFPRIKEWAYAGFFFDLVGATYSQIAVFGFLPQTLFMVLPFAFGTVSYIYFHKLYENREAKVAQNSEISNLA